MKKSSLVAVVLAVSCMVSTCFAAGNSSLFGMMHGKQYVNKYFGITATIPKNWSAAVTPVKQNAGKMVILQVVKDHANSSHAAIIRIAAKKLPAEVERLHINADTILKSSVYLLSRSKYKPTNVSPLTHIKLGKRTVSAQSFDLTLDKFTVQERMYATMVRGYIIIIGSSNIKHDTASNKVISHFINTLKFN